MKLQPILLLSFILMACSTAHDTPAFNAMPLIAMQQQVMQLAKHAYSWGNDVNIRAGNAVDPDTCFDQHSNQQINFIGTYNKAYIGCTTDARNAKDELSEQHAEERITMLTRGDAVCSPVISCEQYKDGLDFFDCYYNATNNYEEVYNMNSQSKSLIDEIQEQYRVIENQQSSCSTKAHNEYVQGLAESKKALAKCLAGEISPQPTESPEVPTTSSSTSTSIADT